MNCQNFFKCHPLHINKYIYKYTNLYGKLRFLIWLEVVKKKKQNLPYSDAFIELAAALYRTKTTPKYKKLLLLIKLMLK